MNEHVARTEYHSWILKMPHAKNKFKFKVLTLSSIRKQGMSRLQLGKSKYDGKILFESEIILDGHWRRADVSSA